jgi:hypothetical protein
LDFKDFSWKTLCNLVKKLRVTLWEKHRENAVKRRAKTEFVSLRSTFLDRITGFMDLQDFFVENTVKRRENAVKRRAKTEQDYRIYGFTGFFR